MAVDLIDTDSVLALVYSEYGQWFLERWPTLELTDTVWKEVTDDRQADAATVDAASKAEQLLRKSKSVTDGGVETDERVVQEVIDESGVGYGEAGIFDVMCDARRDARRVFYYDTDVEQLQRRAKQNGVSPPELFVVSEVFNILSESEQLCFDVDPEEETMKVIAGRGWHETQNLRRLLQNTGISSGFDEFLLLNRVERCSHDLYESNRS